MAFSQSPLWAQNNRSSRPAFNVVPISISGISVVNGQLVANGLVGSHPFTAPITTTASPNAADPTCPILNLHLDPTHLALLGLNVDTSPICLEIVGNEAPGNLLGNLVCGVANLLNGGLDLGTILNSLSTSDLTTLLNGLTNVLNRAVFNPLASSAALAGAACPVLDLSLGPVDLNLLGLEVSLDNCSGGPVTLDITAVPGAGNLLGNLICALTNALNGGANINGILAILQHIANVISGLTLL
jgi:hypothetical protein